MTPLDPPAASGSRPGAPPDRHVPERRADLRQRNAIARRLAQVEAEILAARESDSGETR